MKYLTHLLVILMRLIANVLDGITVVASSEYSIHKISHCFGSFRPEHVKYIVQ